MPLGPQGLRSAVLVAADLDFPPGSPGLVLHCSRLVVPIHPLSSVEIHYPHSHLTLVRHSPDFLVREAARRWPCFSVRRHAPVPRQA